MASIGDKKFNNCQHLEMEIIEIIDSKKVKIRFVDSGYEAIVYTGNFLKGNVKDKISIKNKKYNRYGYVGSESKNVKKDKAYSYWLHMIRRTCDIDFKNEHRNLAYKDCDVCDEWLNYSNFKKWFDKNYYECPFGGKMCLDKDILHKGNKIYSPENCCFVPNNINVAFLKQKYHKNKNIPIGSKQIKLKNGKFKYIVRVTEHGKEHHVGVFYSKQEAFMAYKEEKERYLKELAELYKPYIPQRVYKAMIDYEVEDND